MDDSAKKMRLSDAQRWQTLGRISGRIADRVADTLAPATRECEAARELLAPQSEAYWLLTSAIQAGKQAEELVDRLRMLGGSHPRRRGQHRLSTIVHEALQIARAVAPPATVIRLIHDDEPAIVDVDPCQVQQLVLALCLNAFEAMNGDGGVIEMSLEFPLAGARSRSLAWLSVKDPSGNVSRILVHVSHRTRHGTALR